MPLRPRRTGIATGDQAMFVRREVFDGIGGFPLQPLMEDIELSRRLLRRSRPACLRARVTTSGRRWEQRGVWRTIVLMWRLRWAYWRGVPAGGLRGAVTECGEYERRARRQEDRLDSAGLGQGATLKQRALEQALQLAS